MHLHQGDNSLALTGRFDRVLDHGGDRHSFLGTVTLELHAKYTRQRTSCNIIVFQRSVVFWLSLPGVRKTTPPLHGYCFFFFKGKKTYLAFFFSLITEDERIGACLIQQDTHHDNEWRKGRKKNSTAAYDGPLPPPPSHHPETSLTDNPSVKVAFVGPNCPYLKSSSWCAPKSTQPSPLPPQYGS